MPTLIGEVTLNTRIMLTNRAGRPRSWTSAASDSVPAAQRAGLRDPAQPGRPVRSAPAASSDEPPASPPRKKYPAMSRASQTGGLSTGLP